uniref:Primary ciliary dyskinesia protein 1-like n=1 Tax=Saccoglossus kowalevskii TaxID=10224 RepID=A0ABM0GMC6_SACKO|nr:PREDICTED: primary ciliary dyskinesia protein 1-like [Saccoglossus kowalevskii]
MAVARPVNQGKNGIRTNGIVVPETLVAPKKKQSVPNHLLETKIFHKVNQNSLVQARPGVVHFGGYDLANLHKQTLRIANISGECLQMHIIPPTSAYFRVKYKKQERLVPGLTMDIIVEFVPDEWRYYYDCIRIHCKDDENLLIPIHAYPVMNTADFPEIVHFPPVPLSHSLSKIIPLRCNAPIDFEYQLTYLESHPAFSVSPLSGIVPANGEVSIAVTFTPTDFITAHMKLQLNISQFNSKPLVCTFTGVSEPGLARAEVEERMREDTFDEDSPLLDPHSISPVNMARRKRKSKSKSRTVQQPPLQEIDYAGFRFPTNLNSTHAVSYVLNQEQGKMRAKDLRDAVLAKKESGPGTRQMKEALFEHEVKQDVLSERRNQLRWQVHLGREQITSFARMDIIDARVEAEREYHFQRGDPLADIEFNRACTACTQKRTRRRLGYVPDIEAKFDTYTNDPWVLRHRAIGRFQQAAWKVIVRLRVNKRIRLVKQLVVDYRAGRAGREPSATYGDNKDVNIKDLPLHITRENVLPYAFPTYTAPNVKDDMAPDALGSVPYKPTEVFVKRKVPYSSLKVPQQYKCMGYKLHNTHNSSSGYVPPKLVKPLRTGAEDEIISLPAPPPPGAAWVHEPTESLIGEVIERSHNEEQAMALVPPPALFNPIEYPSLHIFNPSPGLQVFLPPLPYAEVDPDFHLCPLPRYTHKDPNSKHAATLKKFLDREDVIRGVMQWKKFPSQGLVSLSNTPTLTNVWVPRWTDPFSQDMLPEDMPVLLDGLPVDDREELAYSDTSDDEREECEDELPEKSDKIILTPEMVNAQFPLIDLPQSPSPRPETVQASEDFPHGTKLPIHNNPVSSTGPVQREKRERELDMFLKKRYNRLGDRVQAKITHMENLTTNPELILK